MNELTVTFRLSERDQRRLRGMIRKVTSAASGQREAEVILAHVLLRSLTLSESTHRIAKHLPDLHER